MKKRPSGTPNSRELQNLTTKELEAICDSLAYSYAALREVLRQMYRTDTPSIKCEYKTLQRFAKDSQRYAGAVKQKWMVHLLEHDLFLDSDGLPSNRDDLEDLDPNWQEDS